MDIDYEKIERIFKEKPIFKLLRSHSSPLILSFFYKEFKEKERVTISYDELSYNLLSYLEYLKEIGIEHYSKEPKQYLNDWCDENFLRKSLHDEEIIFTLTSDSEKALKLVEQSFEKSNFISTQCRFGQILNLLKEIKIGTSKTAEERIEILRKEKERIEEEIKNLESIGIDLNDNRSHLLKEKFILANQLVKELCSDFQEIAENFRELSRKIYEEQLNPNLKKGDVISHFLDFNDELKKSEQGQSFYGFWDLLIDTDKKIEINSMIKHIYSLDEFEELKNQKQYNYLRKIERYLTDQAMYIAESNQKIVERLRQILDERNLKEDEQISELAVAVQRLALQLIDSPPSEPDFWEIDHGLQLWGTMARPLASLDPKETEVLYEIQFEDQSTDSIVDILDKDLFDTFFIDDFILTENIDKLLEKYSEICLPEILKIYPVEKGIAELLEYILLAMKDERHFIDHTQIDTVEISNKVENTLITLRIPHVIFRRFKI